MPGTAIRGVCIVVHSIVKRDFIHGKCMIFHKIKKSKKSSYLNSCPDLSSGSNSTI